MGNNWKQTPTPAFIVGSKSYIKGNLHLVFTEAEKHLDGIWKHASLSLTHRYPYWEEILDVRYTFFEDTDDVCQILPPKNEYVNAHKNCFHLWSPVGRRLTPLKEC